MTSAYLNFPKQPSLEDLVEFFHAQPGVDYLICAIGNQMEATREENGSWRPLPGAPFAKVGDHDAVLMCRGEVIQGTSVQVTTPQFFHDRVLPAEFFLEGASKPTNGSASGRKN